MALLVTVLKKKAFVRTSTAPIPTWAVACRTQLEDSLAQLAAQLTSNWHVLQANIFKRFGRSQRCRLLPSSRVLSPMGSGRLKLFTSRPLLCNITRQSKYSDIIPTMVHARHAISRYHLPLLQWPWLSCPQRYHHSSISCSA